LYSDLYGPYNRDVYSVVEADIGIGMEFDGLVLMLSSFYWYYNDTPKTDLTIIVPHETAHQWFFSMVGNDQAMEGWLDESIATYSEALFYENYYPDELEWWWDVRVNDHMPWGYIDNTIYLPGGVPDYFDTVYRVGALFHRDLREIMGDEAYFAFLKDYVQTYKYELVTKPDFLNMLASYTSADLTALYTEYFQYPLD
jgi:aminopeptidase N